MKRITFPSDTHALFIVGIEVEIDPDKLFFIQKMHLGVDKPVKIVLIRFKMLTNISCFQI